MRFPHRDDPSASVSRRPYDDHHPAAQKPYRKETQLPLPIRRNGQGGAGKHFARKRHIETAIFERGLALNRIESDFHVPLLLQ
jgi:hypothetical protein